MKKNIGNKFAFYPTPVIVVGAFVDGKPDFTLVAHIGIVTHDRAIISLNKAHYIKRGIKENKVLTVNVVDESWLEQAVVSGSISGRNTDKSSLFGYTLGGVNAPVIDSSKLSMECAVEDIYEIGAFENFVVKVVNTFAEESILTNDGKPDYEKFKPVLFEMPNYTFLKTGQTIGGCKSFMKNNIIGRN